MTENYRLLAYAGGQPMTRRQRLVAIRQDARACKKACLQQQLVAAPVVAQYGAMTGLIQALQGLIASFSALLGAAPSWQAPVPVPVPQPLPQPSQGGKTRFTVSSFNILGSSHTAPGGDAKGYAPGTTRIQWAAQLLEQHHVGVVGFQEMNNDQAVAFKQAAGNAYGLYPGNSKLAMGSQNSIAWRKEDWDFVSGRTVKITSHKGNHWPVPVVRLRNKQTGEEAYFLNLHNAPGYHQGTQQANRDKAVAEETPLINQLRASGLPVIVTGDMNEKDHVYNHFTQDAGLHSANGHPTLRQMGIDWIFGSAGVQFKGYFRDRGALEKKVSDHGMIGAQVEF